MRKLLDQTGFGVCSGAASALLWRGVDWYVGLALFFVLLALWILVRGGDA